MKSSNSALHLVRCALAPLRTASESFAGGLCIECRGAMVGCLPGAPSVRLLD